MGSNGDYTAADDGRFAYGGGHMEKHASLNGLGDLNSAGLATELRRQIGTDINFTYGEPQLAGGMAMTPSDYATLLRKIVRGDLTMHDVLGTHPVCTSPATCANAKFAPTPPGESWHYSIGHWVEDDPNVGDGAFSSPGAFGFYPVDRPHEDVLRRAGEERHERRPDLGLLRPADPQGLHHRDAAIGGPACTLSPDPADDLVGSPAWPTC